MSTRFRRLLLLAMLLWSCCFIAPACSGPQSSGESHFGLTKAFLRVCEDGVCENGDSCACAVCTVSCEQRADCAERILGPGAVEEDLPDNVVCRAPACGASGPVAPGGLGESLCDVSCETETDCAFLDVAHEGKRHTCNSGSCRTVEEPQEPAETPAAERGPVCPAGRSLLPGEFSPSGLGVCLDTTEVTVASYRLCVEAGDCEEPEAGNYLTSARENHPIEWVSPAMAESYCASVDSRLPLLAEFSAAIDGPLAGDYPWGEGAPTVDDLPQRLCGLTTATTCEVDSFPAGDGEFGHSDLLGNVAEWVQQGSDMCAAGGSFLDSEDALSSTSCKTASDADATIGFRCARDL